MANDISDEDKQLFQQLVGKVKTISHDKVVHKKKKPAPKARQREKDEQQVLQDLLSDEYQPIENDNSEALYFARQGLQIKLLKKFKQGKLSTQAVLDLHQMTVSQARMALSEFLQNSQKNHYRCVRIIHGKGHHSEGGIPVIKERLNGWLRQWDDVLAFSTARPVDGGTGAIYVLLKRR